MDAMASPFAAKEEPAAAEPAPTAHTLLQATSSLPRQAMPGAPMASPFAAFDALAKEGPGPLQPKPTAKPASKTAAQGSSPQAKGIKAAKTKAPKEESYQSIIDQLNDAVGEQSHIDEEEALEALNSA